MDEVDTLSSSNSQLEEEVATLRNEISKLLNIKLQNQVLLAIVGEKEEELENMIEDMKEVRLLYKTEIDHLLQLSLVSSQ